MPALAAVALAVSTTTAELAVPLIARAEAPIELEPDLARSTTDVYTLELAGEPQSERKDGQELKIWPIKVVPLAVGPLPVAVHWRSASEPEVAVSTVELTVNEPPDLKPDADIADIKKPAAAWPLLWPWLLLLAAAWGAYEWWRRRRRPGGAAAAPPDNRTPAQRALDDLAALERSSLWGEGRLREFYFQLSEILRAYLERRYGMPALTLTTHELTRQLRQMELDRQPLQLFKELFDRADLVKFAKERPEGGQGGLDLEAARRFVELTTPKPPPVPAGAPPAPGGKP